MTNPQQDLKNQAPAQAEAPSSFDRFCTAIRPYVAMVTMGAGLTSCGTTQTATWTVTKNGQSDSVTSSMHGHGLAGLGMSSEHHFADIKQLQKLIHATWYANNRNPDKCANQMISQCPALADNKPELVALFAKAHFMSPVDIALKLSQIGLNVATATSLLKVAFDGLKIDGPSDTYNIDNSNKNYYRNFNGGGGHCPPSGPGTGGNLLPGNPGSGGNGITPPGNITPTGVVPAGTPFGS